MCGKRTGRGHCIYQQALTEKAIWLCLGNYLSSALLNCVLFFYSPVWNGKSYVFLDSISETKGGVHLGSGDGELGLK